MTTEQLSASDPTAIARACELLRAGEVVAFPTETVYGLGANGLDPIAVGKIFEAKGRPNDNPLILHVSSFEQALPLWQASQDQLQHARQLAEAFWPGPLSLVLPASSVVPKEVTAGLNSVAIRAPANPVAQALLMECEFPLAAPSANLSGRPSPTSADHVATTLSGCIAAILDGGITDLGIESTVLDIREFPPSVLRPGSISKKQIEAVTGDVRLATNTSNAPSPGTRHRHYQPQGMRLRLVDAEAIAAKWDEAAAILCFEDTAQAQSTRSKPVISLPRDVTAFGAELYSALYTLEQSGEKLLYVEKVPDTPEWDAIRDRLARAAEN
ncbi:MAG: threonylcarbamoyl-AMP synthase [Pseudomonadales bacterium]|nr:threonylcarbamoyl-AMP synthase [Pseudomonadales bacterium]